MGVESKVEFLIVDTSAFIKNAPLQEYGHKIITEPSVVKEIKDKRQLKRLVVLPYDLEVKEAYAEDIKFVTEFSKKTGDFKSLSPQDIKVIALTYRYEKEKVGTSHLKQEPDVKKVVLDSNVLKSEDYSKNLAGFYMPEGNKDKKETENTGGAEDVDNECTKEDDKAIDEEEKQEAAVLNNKLTTKSERSDKDDKGLIHSCETSDKSNSEAEYDTAESDEGNLLENLSKKFVKLNCDPSELQLTCGKDLSIDDILKPVDSCNEEDEVTGDSESQDEADEEDEGETESGDDYGGDEEDDGWITPNNITSMRKKMDSGTVKEKAATVACLTMDFAMQNVLMQIGLNVASIEGKIIKEMRTFILRCYSCFKTTGVTTKLFCPNCGNKTLKKVAVKLDDEGNEQIFINYRKRMTAKGKKFSLPTFQGGKHACNPILFEDQRVPDQRQTKLGRSKNDPLDEDYIAGSSPFQMRDVNSRAAMLGIKSGVPTKYWMRKNPNEPRKHKK